MNRMRRVLLLSTRRGKACVRSHQPIHPSKEPRMSPSTNRIKFFLLFLALVCCCQRANAQGLTGQISGAVTDTDGAVVANATLKLTNAQTGQIRATTSSSDGRFVFPELLPGSFTLTVE